MARSFETLWAESAASLDYAPAAGNIKGSRHIDAFVLFERHQSNQAHDLDLSVMQVGLTAQAVRDSAGKAGGAQNVGAGVLH